MSKRVMMFIVVSGCVCGCVLMSGCVCRYVCQGERWCVLSAWLSILAYLCVCMSVGVRM